MQRPRPSASTSVVANCPEERLQVTDHLLRSLERGEVSAIGKLAPVHDVVVVATGERPKPILRNLSEGWAAWPHAASES